MAAQVRRHYPKAPGSQWFRNLSPCGAMLQNAVKTEHHRPVFLAPGAEAEAQAAHIEKLFLHPNARASFAVLR